MFVLKFWITPVILALADSFYKEMTWTCSLSWRERCSCGEENKEENLKKEKLVWNEAHRWGNCRALWRQLCSLGTVPGARVFTRLQCVCVRGEGGARAVIFTVIGLETAVTAWTWAKRTVSFVPGMLFKATVVVVSSSSKIFICPFTGTFK